MKKVLLSKFSEENISHPAEINESREAEGQLAAPIDVIHYHKPTVLYILTCKSKNLVYSVANLVQVPEIVDSNHA